MDSLKKSNPEKRIISVFQPHRYSRLKLLKKEFALSFKSSDRLILCPVYPAGEKIDKQYDDKKFATQIAKNSDVK